MKVALRLDAKDEFSSLGDQMGRWLDNVVGPDFRRYRPQDRWEPAVNVYEGPDAYHIIVDLAGVVAESVDLRVSDDQLTLSGERPSPRPGGAAGAQTPIRVHLMEIDHGPFQRVLELPESADPESIEASYRNGFLWVKMSKKA